MSHTTLVARMSSWASAIALTSACVINPRLGSALRKRLIRVAEEPPPASAGCRGQAGSACESRSRR